MGIQPATHSTAVEPHLELNHYANRAIITLCMSCTIWQQRRQLTNSNRIIKTLSTKVLVTLARFAPIFCIHLAQFSSIRNISFLRPKILKA